MERAVYLTGSDTLLRDVLPTEIQVPFASNIKQDLIMPPSKSTDFSIKSGELERIEQALRQTHGNIKKAAVLLQVSRRTLYRKLEHYQIDYNRIRGGNSSPSTRNLLP